MWREQELDSQEILPTTKLKRRLTSLTQEVDELRKADQETKKLLFKKSRETLRLYARNDNLQAEVDGLKEKLGNRDEEVTQLREKLAKLEEEMANLKEELVHKDELFQETKEKLTNDVAESYAMGFEDAMAQVACVYLGVDLSQTGLTKTFIDGQLVDVE